MTDSNLTTNAQNTNKMRSCILGLTVGDALGMYGNTCDGTLSDYTAVALATLDTLQDGIQNPKTWNAVHLGADSSNEQEALFRLVPLSVYLSLQSNSSIASRTFAVHESLELTQKQPIELMAGGFLAEIIKNLIYKEPKEKAVKNAYSFLRFYYRTEFSFDSYLKHFLWLEDPKHLNLSPIADTSSIVYTVKNALFCFLTTSSYKECVLKAVNLEHENRAVAAVAGGLSGIYYGSHAIPEEWLSLLANQDYAESLCLPYENLPMGNCAVI